MRTTGTLRELYMSVETDSSLNLFEGCRWNKLEVLHLSDFSLSVAKLSSESETLLPCMKTLQLDDMKLSAFDLSGLITLCPKIESLTLLDVKVGHRATLKLSISTLKKIWFLGLHLDRFVLKADNLESLRLGWCDLQLFKLVKNKALKVLNIYHSEISCFDTGERIKTLENVDVYVSSTIKGSFYDQNLFDVISKSSNLRRLRLWPVTRDSCYGFIDLERICAELPQLTQLSLYYLKEVDFRMQGSSLLKNVAFLDLGFAGYHFFSDRIERFIERCPNLKKMVVRMFDCQPKKFSYEFGACLLEYSSSIVQLARKYPGVEFEFKDKGRIAGKIGV